MIVLGQDLSTTVEFGLGTFFGLLAALFYGAYYLVTQQGRLSLDTLSYFWITAVSSTLLLLALIIVAGQPLTGYDPFTILSFLASGVFVQVLGWLALNYAQGYLPASIVAPTLLIQPVLTAIFAYWLLGETFTFWHILGGVTVLFGIYLIHRSRWKKMKLLDSN
jgi:drug/metabolite transporter (DMT)-like permease